MTTKVEEQALLETPSGKGAGDENFPVGSWLVARELRPHVATYYAFARAIDDIADNPDLSAEEKVRRLRRFAEAIEGAHGEDPALAKAQACHASLVTCGVPLRHASDLTVAFIQDARQNRYTDWSDLVGYCDYSANPVGRFLLALHETEAPAAYAASDALCTALQVINHLQDCGKDYRDMDRIYLPQDWMAEAGAKNVDLAGKALTPGLRRVLDRCLDATEDLLNQARRLPGLLPSRRLALESAIIYRLACRLTLALRRRDPLAERVAFGKPAMLRAAVGSSLAVFLGYGEGRRGR
ncbi:MAG: squalene synthase HpnC [Rhodospirillales bacterium]